MLLRSISAVVGIGLFLGCCFAGALPFALAVTVMTVLAIHEFVTQEQEGLISRPPGADAEPAAIPVDGRVNRILAVLAVPIPLAVYAAAAQHGFGVTLVSVFSLVVILACIGMLVRSARTGAALGSFRANYGLFGIAYCGLLFSGMVLVHSLTVTANRSALTDLRIGAWMMLFVAVCVWSTDTFAYLVGRAIGRHKLAPSISPGKTIEGALGGLAGAIVAGILFGRGLGLGVQHCVIVGAIAGVFGQLGDLFESALKREIGIKDFGRLIPGHGGALDRFDSLLFVAPLAYIYLHFIAGF